MTDKTKTCDIRFTARRGLPAVRHPVFSPESFAVTILQRINSLEDTTPIDFIEGVGAVHTTTAKSIRKRIGDVVALIESGEMNIDERNFIRHKTPRDCFKCEKIQALLNKYNIATVA